jgi:hypothetical protein
MNDFSRHGYIYPTHEQSEVFDKFKIFKVEENQHKAKIKVVCSDEYYGRYIPYGWIPGPFLKFIEENGIVAQYSLPYEPR